MFALETITYFENPQIYDDESKKAVIGTKSKITYMKCDFRNNLYREFNKDE